jgi:enterochelin esterase-like enzyme
MHPVLCKDHFEIYSSFLHRTVKIDCFLPGTAGFPSGVNLLLINDGQDLERLGFSAILQELLKNSTIRPILCVGIYAGDRMMEYGTACRPDYMGRGKKARLYSQFLLEELIPFIMSTYHITDFSEKSIAGFSLGGLSALDVVWNYPGEFCRAGVFSGSLWWRTKAIDDGYVEDTDRIMHSQVRHGKHNTGLKFFFQAGALDETMDRNNNGIIDSIEDTITLIDELVQKGYERTTDIEYLQLEDGRHDIATWARAMPAFLKWGWGRNYEL